MKVAVVGATGMVGEVMLKVLAERNLPISELVLVASERSVGKKMLFQGASHTVVGLQTAVDMAPDIALFSAGGDTSLEWAPKFAAAGTTVIDNSSAWRMDATKKLVVPEINAHELSERGQNYCQSKLFHHSVGNGFSATSQGLWNRKSGSFYLSVYYWNRS